MTARLAYQHLTSRGLPHHVAAGMVGNIQAESGFAEDVINGQRLGDNGTAFGAFQHRGDRIKNLVQFAQSNNLNPQKLETQLDFAIHEMASGSDAGAKRALELMLQTEDAGKAAQIFMENFERPNADPAINKLGQRIGYAKSFTGDSAGLQNSPHGDFKGRLEQYRQNRQNAPVELPKTQDDNSFQKRLDAYRGDQKTVAQAPKEIQESAASSNKPLPKLPEVSTAIENHIWGVGRLGKGAQFKGETLNPENQKLADLLHRLKFSQNDEDIQAQITAAFPDAQFQEMADGTVARFGGVEAVLNQPGISRGDIDRLAKDTALIGLPSALTAGTGGLVLGTLGRLAGAGLGAGGGQIASDQLSVSNDGVTEPTIKRTALAAGVGVTGEGLAGLASRFGPALITKIRNLVGRGQFVKDGRPTEAARAAFREAGVPDEEITPAMLQQFNRLNATDDIAKARIADAQSLPEPVPLTTGQATQNPATLTIENSAKKGVFGEEGAAQGLAKQESQLNALNANADLIRGRVSGGNPIQQRGAGAAAAQMELSGLRDAAKAKVSANFKLAKQGHASINVDAVATFRSDLGKALRTDFDLDGLPTVSRLLSQLKTPSNTKAVNLGALENWRRRVSGAMRSASRGTQTTSATEAAAFRQMLASYDDSISTTLSDAIVKGSADDISKWRSAIKSRREFADRFESVPIINRLTETTRQGGERVLKVDAADAAAEIFGRGMLGLKKGVARDLTQLQKELSPQAWNSIRDEATLHLFAAADGSFKAGTQFAKRFDIMRRDAPGVLKTLFNGEERALLNQLARTAKTIERAPRITADMNPSGTGAANAILTRARNIGGPVGEFVTAFGSNFFRKTGQAMKVAESSRYFAGVLQRRSAEIPTAFKAVGLASGNESLRDE